jgi:hypothetical protein
MDRTQDLVDQEGIYRALQYRYTYWPQPDNATMMRQKLVDVSIFETSSTNIAILINLKPKVQVLQEADRFCF